MTGAEGFVCARQPSTMATKGAEALTALATRVDNSGPAWMGYGDPTDPRPYNQSAVRLSTLPSRGCLGRRKAV